MPTPTLPPPDAAYDKVFHTLYGRTFLSKLAAAGYPALTERDVNNLFNLSTKLESAEAQIRQKQADDMYGGAISDLDNLMGYQPQTGVYDVAIRKTAADLLQQDPELYDSILSLKQYEMQQYAASAA